MLPGFLKTKTFMNDTTKILLAGGAIVIIVAFVLSHSAKTQTDTIKLVPQQSVDAAVATEKVATATTQTQLAQQEAAAAYNQANNANSAISNVFANIGSTIAENYGG